MIVEVKKILDWKNFPEDTPPTDTALFFWQPDRDGYVVDQRPNFGTYIGDGVFHHQSGHRASGYISHFAIIEINQPKE